MDTVIYPSDGILCRCVGGIDSEGLNVSIQEIVYTTNMSPGKLVLIFILRH